MTGLYLKFQINSIFGNQGGLQYIGLTGQSTPIAIFSRKCVYTFILEMIYTLFQITSVTYKETQKPQRNFTLITARMLCLLWRTGL